MYLYKYLHYYENKSPTLPFCLISISHDNNPQLARCIYHILPFYLFPIALYMLDHWPMNTFLALIFCFLTIILHNNLHPALLLYRIPHFYHLQTILLLIQFSINLLQKLNNLYKSLILCYLFLKIILLYIDSYCHKILFLFQIFHHLSQFKC